MDKVDDIAETENWWWDSYLEMAEDFSKQPVADKIPDKNCGQVLEPHGEISQAIKYKEPDVRCWSKKHSATTFRNIQIVGIPFP